MKKKFWGFHHEVAFVVFPDSEAQNTSLAALNDIGRGTLRWIIREAEEQSFFGDRY